MSFIHHFIHLYFFTEFEILFYIYYILPYEKQLVYNMFSKDSILKSLTNSFKDDDKFTSLLDSFETHNFDKQCDLEQDRIDANHNKLWTYCFIYIIIMNSLLFLFFVKDFIICYRNYNPKFSLSSLSSLTSLSSLSSPTFCNQTTKYKKSDFDIEMIDLEAAEKRISNSNNVSYNSFCLYYWHKSEFFLATWNTIQFIILIGVFEYLFFITIVNKYKVVSAKMLLCKLIQG